MSSTKLEIEAVSKYYQRGTEKLVALADLSFRTLMPEVIVIAGPSGSGKTTLLNLLACFDQPDSGRIKLDGIFLDEIAEKALDEFRNRKLGFIFQHFNLLSVLSALENVELALTVQAIPKVKRRQRAIEMLKLVGLGDRLSHKPAQLSGGQQQRVAIARALVGGPCLVLADEPTGNLDRKTANEILALIEMLHHQIETTFIIATHDQVVMDRAHRLMKLEDGRWVS